MLKFKSRRLLFKPRPNGYSKWPLDGVKTHGLSWGLWSHFGLGGLGGLVGLVGLGGEGGLVGSDWVWK